MERVEKNMVIGQLLQADPGFTPILMESGMHCLGCPSSQMESLSDACMVHGIDSDTLVGKLNSYLDSKK